MKEERQYVDNESPNRDTLSYPVVGIGASADGLEAFIGIVSNLPRDTGMAFVLVSQMAQQHESYPIALLQQHTALPVSVVENGSRPLPDHIYVMPPDTLLTISEGRLVLEAREDRTKETLTIDRFFLSLALDQKNMAVGAVLSGIERDGAFGLKAIRGQGGITLMEESGMPRRPDIARSGLADGDVDLVVAPAEMGAELGRLGRLYAHPELRVLEVGGPPPNHGEFLLEIYKMLRSVAGIDFGLYKAGTVQRRISRRLLITQSESLAEYYQLLRARPEEVGLLHEDLLVGLSWFFRDPHLFEALRTKVFPKLFESYQPQQQIRIWCAGCSTGEEVYSLAIAILEFTAVHHLNPEIQIFGTDVSNRSIEKAQSGFYPSSIAAELSPERLSRFFVPVDQGYQVAAHVRDLCVFTRQNLANDPPFSRIDLLICRNVLIYLGAQLQNRVIPQLHYALKPDRFLVLGKSEALRGFSASFNTLDRKNRIFIKQDGIGSKLGLPRTALSARAELLVTPPISSHMELQLAADRTVLAAYGPPGLVLNSHLEVLQTRGEMAPYLELAQSPGISHLMQVLDSSIAPVVCDAVQRAIENDVPVRLQRISLQSEDGSSEFDLEVYPVQVLPAQDHCFLVLFVNREARAFQRAGDSLLDPLAADHPNGERALISHLQQDSSPNRVYLQSLVEERDLENQELASRIEEVQTTNRELQFLNQELGTTKEKLQSANEKLQIANDELQQRNLVLTEATNALSDLLISLNIPVLLLNNELKIRQFTPLAQKLLNVRSSDIGRPLTEIRLNVAIDNLEAVLNGVLETLDSREIDIQDKEGRWHILRVRPYRTCENKIDGVVLVLLEIDQLRRSQLELRHARDFASNILEGIQVPLAIVNSNLTVRSVNQAFLALVHLSSEELQDRFFPDLMQLEFGQEHWKEVLESLGGRTGEAGSFEREFQVPQTATFMFVRVRSVTSDRSWALLLTVEDISKRKNAEIVITRENQFLAGQVRSTSQALGRSQGELRSLNSRLLTSQEEERQRVARELHDDVGQQLALIQMDLEQVHQRLDTDPNSLADQINSVCARVTSLSNDVRSLSHRLHPSILDDLGLGLALKSLVEEFGKRERMPATLTRLNMPEHLPRPVAAALYRIAQEALRNVSQHAGKTHVRVVVEGNPFAITLKIVDMGEGFDQEETAGGLGLLSMAERSYLVGGSFEIQSELGRGTAITVTVPLPATPGETS